jgi:hypothetical protein
MRMPTALAKRLFNARAFKARGERARRQIVIEVGETHKAEIERSVGVDNGTTGAAAV